jgi:arylsulfatase A-like enzyme
MNHAVSFIEASVKGGAPFFAVVWFVTPHTPVSAGNEARALYPDLPIREQHWFGAISAMDAQIGRLLAVLRALTLEENTIVWFCSDNGPSWVHELASAGPLRGKKSELYEGGIRVPAIVRWPAGFSGGRILDVPLSTNDFLPTLLAAAGVKRSLPPLDGQNVLPVLRGEVRNRDRPIFFDYPAREFGSISWVPTEARQTAVIDGTLKLVSVDSGKSYQLFDLAKDEAEQSDVAAGRAMDVRRLQQGLRQWQESCAASLKGADYR